jgi:hypothetical protein
MQNKKREIQNYGISSEKNKKPATPAPQFSTNLFQPKKL